MVKFLLIIEKTGWACSRFKLLSGLFHSVVMLSSLTQTSLCLTWNTSHQVQQRNGLTTVSSHVQLLSGESRGERDNWERHVPDFCFPRNSGEQAGSPPGSRFPGYRKIRWALTVLTAAMCPPPCTSQRVSLLGPWVSNSVAFRTGTRSWDHCMWGKQHSSTSGLG